MFRNLCSIKIPQNMNKKESLAIKAHGMQEPEDNKSNKTTEFHKILFSVVAT